MHITTTFAHGSTASVLRKKLNWRTRGEAHDFLRANDMGGPYEVQKSISPHVAFTLVRTLEPSKAAATLQLGKKDGRSSELEIPLNEVGEASEAWLLADLLDHLQVKSMPLTFRVNNDLSIDVLWPSRSSFEACRYRNK